MEDRFKLRQSPDHHLVHSGLSGPDTGQDPLHTLGPPQRVEEHQVVGQSPLAEHCANRTLNKKCSCHLTRNTKSSSLKSKINDKQKFHRKETLSFAIRNWITVRV